MLYNIDFDIAALIFMIVYFAFIKLQFQTDKLTNRVFCHLIAVIILSDIFDIISAVAISNGPNVPIWANYLINILYYCTVPLAGYGLYMYVEVLLKPESRPKIFKKINLFIINLFMFLIVTDPWTKLIFFITEKGEYSHGPLYNITYELVLYYLAFSIVILLINRKEFNNKQVYSIIAFVVITMIAIMLQMLVFPTVLFTYFGASIASFIVLFAFETPDYRMLVDLTEKLNINRKELEEARRKDIQMQNTIHELMNSASWAVSFDEYGNYADSIWSNEIKTLLGYDESDNINNETIWQDSLHPEDFDRAMKQFTDGLMGLSEYNTIFRLRCKNGNYKWFNGRGELINDSDGKPISFQGVIKDVTSDIEMERLNKERIHALDELKTSELALQAALEEAKEASNAKSTFLSNMSHDIRTPMNAIIGFSNLALEEGPNSENLPEYLEKIKSSGNHLISLINNVLDMNKIESGKVNMEYVDGSITEVCNNLKSILMANLNEKQLSFEVSIDNVMHDYVCFDRLHLNQVLLNCLSNSIKFTPNGGKLTLSLTEHPIPNSTSTEFEIIITDTGIGMSKEFLKSVFDPFERERSSTISKIQGTGLGMSIVKSLTELMGGTIKVESKLNVGTKYIITLPVDIAVKHEDKSGLESEELTKEEMISKLNGLHVLLVDDNSVNRMLGRKLLGRLGITMDEAEDGKVALDILKDSSLDKYQLILMDIQMPVMNGYDTADAIRLFDNELSKIPIIAMTADAFEEDKRKCIEHGMNGHIAKPILVDNLINTIYSILYMV